jgi:HEAT repeat protein
MMFPFKKVGKNITFGIFTVLFFVGCAITKENIIQYEKEKNLTRLIKVYTSSDSLKIRYWALKSISRLKDADAIPYLIQGLEEDHWILREEAVHGLGELRNKKAMLAIIPVLNDPSILVRLEAATAAIMIGKEGDTSDLETALYDPDPSIRKKVAYILECIGNRRSLPALLEAIDDPDISVRQMVISALAKFGDDSTIELLLKTLKDVQWEVRREAVISLGKLGRVEAIDKLKPLINSDPNDTVRYNSKLAVEQISKNVTQKKCNRCHSYYKAIAVKRTPNEWKKIVRKMIAKDGNWINEKETRLITDYLVESESILENVEEKKSKIFYAKALSWPTKKHRVIQ